MSWWANSSAGKADASHMGLHGIFYGSIIYLWYLARKGKLSIADEIRARFRCARWNVIILLIFLAGLVFGEALPKFWRPTAVSGPDLVVAVVIGIFGTLLTIFILRKMRVDHGGLEYGEECDRGRRSSHRVLFLDAIGDISISLAVLISGVNIWIDPRRSWLDPILTFIAAGIIIWQAYAMLRSLRKDEFSHDGHHH